MRLAAKNVPTRQKNQNNAKFLVHEKSKQTQKWIKHTRKKNELGLLQHIRRPKIGREAEQSSIFGNNIRYFKGD